MSNLPHAEALFGASHGSSVPGQTYTNPYGNYTVVDTVTEDMLDLVHPHWYGFPPMNEMWYGLVAFFLSCMAMLAISGNFIVLYVFCCTKTLRSPSNYFVVNLALSDFILMFCMCPPLVINSYYHTWIFGPFWCQVYGAIGSLTGCTSIFTMVCISFDRYNVIVKVSFIAFLFFSFSIQLDSWINKLHLFMYLSHFLLSVTFCRVLVQNLLQLAMHWCRSLLCGLPPPFGPSSPSLAGAAISQRVI